MTETNVRIKSSFACPFCGSDTKVIDSRLSNDNTIRRRRKCLNPMCEARCTTREIEDQGGTPHDAKFRLIKTSEIERLLKLMEPFDELRNYLQGFLNEGAGE